MPGELPPEIFDGCTAILGRTGSGKSFTARGLVEGWLEQGRRVCVIDPTDVWYGLRSNAAGDGPGYPVVVFGGDHGDVQIGDRSGARVAEIIATRNMPAVICTAEMTGGERHRFMTDFLGTLYRANRKPLHLVIDEADDIAPQQPLPENRRMLGDVDRIVRRGRVRGFRVLMISQRPAVLNKNVLSMASALVAMRLPGPQDRKAIDAWITGQAAGSEGGNVMATLPGLQTGEGWVWAPESGVLQRLRFPAIRTFDSMRTPAIDEDAIEPTGLAAVEVGDLVALLAPDEVGRGVAPVNTAAAAIAEQRGYERGVVEGRRIGAVEQAEARREMEVAIQAALGYLAPYIKQEEGVGIVDVRRPAPPPTIDAAPAPRALPRRRASAASSEQTSMHAAARRLLIASAQHAPARFTWGQIATLAGLKPSGGHFNAGRKELRDRGYVAESGNQVAATTAGIEAAGEDVPDAPSTPEEVLALWCSRLPSPAPEILRVLAVADGYLPADALAASLGKKPTGGHWNSGVAVLRNNGLIEVEGRSYRAAALIRGGGDG